ncbi:AER008Wp [Eremothecium gossypii ATCC 10895]|uniref:AER008Wp n=1 Tax=Eremothecium gossypii (strain ATCC 10895 / CBS 109.51 / FGSC 9923 / NRRL Y-1056) TaxID=284811 RepID=Q757K4_EREGS|nr:AER008Wp [Eremothecium gossypii ATCC 10895]AAS52692.1 AER008Wp [Eremothecium gossypii ATCC 10895]AEY96997.1 FAER008Wp [Eremothecium gossypii FDAG1]
MDLYEQLPSSQLVFDAQFQFLLECSQQQGVSVLDFLTLSPQQLVKMLNRSVSEISKFQELLREEFRAEVFQANPILPASALKKVQCFTTGDVGIDALLNGGIYTHGITEVFGESSSGKSQFLMQLSLAVQLPLELDGSAGQCVFITTESDLPTKRIESMIKSREIFSAGRVSQSNIFTATCNDWTSQNHILSVQLPILLERNPNIRLVIIDSISHHLRVELAAKTFQQSLDNRSLIDQMAQNLLHLSQKHAVAVVVANQVGDKPIPDLPLKQTIMDYDYQLGFMIGWKDSSIYYRHLRSAGVFDEEVLTDDDDYQKVVSTHERMILRKSQQQQQERQQQQQQQQQQKAQEYQEPSDESLQTQLKLGESSSSPGATVYASKSFPDANTQLSTISPQPSLKKANHINSSLGYTVNTTPSPVIRKKKRVDTKTPNLGLTWANHLSTRIKLSKTHIASQLIEEQDLDYDSIVDSTSLWQVKRSLKVVFSTHADQGLIEYFIRNEGLVTKKEKSG